MAGTLPLPSQAFVDYNSTDESRFAADRLVGYPIHEQNYYAVQSWHVSHIQ